MVAKVNGSHGSSRQPCAVRRPRCLIHQKALLQLPRLGIIAEVERPILAHHRIHRPHPRDMIAPSRWPPGDGDDQQAGILQPLHRAIGVGGQPPLGRQRVVDIGEDTGDGAARGEGKLFQRQHGDGEVSRFLCHIQWPSIEDRQAN